MKVGFDNKIFTMQSVGGVSRYFLELSSYLNKLDEVEAKICAGLHLNRELKNRNDAPSSNFFLDSLFWRRPTAKILKGTSGALSRMQLTQFTPDVIHETYYSNLSTAGIQPRCITVYDFIHEIYYPQSRTKIEAKISSMRRAKFIIAISENTKNDLVQLYPQFANKVRVIHLAPSKFFAIGDSASDFSQPYILYVGSRRGYKNFDSLLLAFASSDYLQNNCRLHVFGNENFSKSENQRFRELGIESFISFFSGTDVELLRQYQGATLLVYPSLYEGFGLPVLEAMSSGCPVLSTNAGSLEEVSGSKGYFFDQASIADMRSKIEGVFKSERLRDELISYGLFNVKRFNWEKTARETLQAYKESVE
jgi:glycosyltransferase involved in cell wall biosynthesis